MAQIYCIPALSAEDIIVDRHRSQGKFCHEACHEACHEVCHEVCQEFLTVQQIVLPAVTTFTFEVQKQRSKQKSCIAVVQLSVDTVDQRRDSRLSRRSPAGGFRPTNSSKLRKTVVSRDNTASTEVRVIDTAFVAQKMFVEYVIRVLSSC